MDVSPVSPHAWDDVRRVLSTAAISPSMLSTLCPRERFLEFVGTGGFAIKSLDIRMGNAYGEAFAAGIRVDTDDEYEMMQRAVITLPKHFGLTEERKNKQFSTLYDMLLSAFKWWYHQRALGWRFHSSEHKFKIKIYKKDVLFAVLSGTFDVKATNQQRALIWDTKFVNSHFRYSWKTDPQVAIYTLFAALHDNLNGVSFNYETPGYLVALVNESTVNFTQHSVLPHVMSRNNLRHVLDHMCHLWRTLIYNTSQKDTFQEAIADVYGESHLCCANNWECPNLSRCYGNAPAYLQIIPDDRTPEHVSNIEVEYDDLLAIAGNETTECLVSTFTDDAPKSHLDAVSVTNDIQRALWG